MYLSPLQSRLAASLLATCLLIALYLALFTPHFALAVELPERPLPIFSEDADTWLDLDLRSPLDPTYEPEFAAFDRSIIGRAPVGVTALTNNVATMLNGVAGTTQVFTFSAPSVSSRGTGAAGVELRWEHNESRERRAEAGEGVAPRQTGQMVFISANTCLQPQPAGASQTTEAPPQLTLYVSTTPANQAPGPTADTDSQVVVPFTEGAVMYNTSSAGAIYVGVYAPNSSLYTGVYNFEIAASVDGWYHSYDAEAEASLTWVDSDSQGALLTTQALTNSSAAPYVMFAQSQSDPSINGLTNSYCGLQQNAQIAGTSNGRLSNLLTSALISRGPGNNTKQQFLFSGLNASTTYLGILAMNGNSSSPAGAGVSGRDEIGVVGGGGHVFSGTNFTTQSGQGNCALISGLSFCDQVAYSVPFNSINPGQANLTNTTILAQWYDGYAQSMYQYFQLALAQIQCNASADQAYSLVRNCTSCAQAYKTWLCTVTIPKCEDFSNNASYLQPRAVFSPFPDGSTLNSVTLAQFRNNTAYNSSRNPQIDQAISPGPYKELLPCDYLCYDLVQSCPAALGFGCPTSGSIGFNSSYAAPPSDKNGSQTCNFQGSTHGTLGSAASRADVSVAVLAAVIFACSLVVI